MRFMLIALLGATLPMAQPALAQIGPNDPIRVLDSPGLEHLQARIDGEPRARILTRDGARIVDLPKVAGRHLTFLGPTAGGPRDTVNLLAIGRIETRQSRGAAMAASIGLTAGIFGFAYSLLSNAELPASESCQRGAFDFSFGPCARISGGRVDAGSALRTGAMTAAIGAVVGFVLGEIVLGRWKVVYKAS